MGKMKQLHIEQMNRDRHLCYVHEQFINQVNESGLPLWMSSMYDNYYHLLESQEEIESQPKLNSDLSTTELDHLLKWEHDADKHDDLPF